MKLSSLHKIFAVNQLRILAAHQADGDINTRIKKNAAPFDIDPAAYITGWGLAIDKLYDGLIQDIQNVATLLSPN